MNFTKDDLDISPSIVFADYKSPLTKQEIDSVERAFYIFMDHTDITPDLICEIFEMNTDEVKRLLVLGHVAILLEITTLVKVIPNVADTVILPIITEDEDEEDAETSASAHANTMSLQLAIERFIQSIHKCFPSVLPAFPSEGGDLIEFLNQFTMVQLIIASW
jgi:hypothetical protein